MTYKTDAQSSGPKSSTGLLDRRRFLRGGVAAGTFVAAAPAFLRQARASSGELNILSWTSEIPPDVVEAFTAKTGIRVNLTPFSSNEELVNKLQATFGEGFDLCMPSFNRAPEFQFLEVLQPLDTNRIKLDAFEPSLLKASTDLWTWDGKLHHIPHVWGSEGMAWRTDMTNITYDTLSYGLLWEAPEYAGKVQMRTTSGLLGLGLWLDASGKLPTNRMLDTYKDEATMRKIYDEILAYAIAHKSRIKQFWDSADATRSGFAENGCVIGETWDGPALAMAKLGQPVAYMAPKEGALAWIDGFSMSGAARNIDQAYAFFDFLLTPETGGKVAIGSHNNSAVKGADAFVPELEKKLFQASYPADALDKLWRYPASPSWFVTARNEYAEKFKVS